MEEDSVKECFFSVQKRAHDQHSMDRWAELLADPLATNALWVPRSTNVKLNLEFRALPYHIVKATESN